MSKLKLDTRHGYEGCVCDEAGPIVANVTTDQNTDLAEEIVATVNWCREHGIDTSNPAFDQKCLEIGRAFMLGFPELVEDLKEGVLIFYDKNSRFVSPALEALEILKSTKEES